MVRRYVEQHGDMRLEVFDRIGRMGFADLARRIKGLALVLAGAGLALSAGKVEDFFDASSYVWPTFFTVVFFCSLLR